VIKHSALRSPQASGSCRAGFRWPRSLFPAPGGSALTVATDSKDSASAVNTKPFQLMRHTSYTNRTEQRHRRRQPRWTTWQ